MTEDKAAKASLAWTLCPTPRLQFGTEVSLSGMAESSLPPGHYFGPPRAFIGGSPMLLLLHESSGAS